MCYMETQTIEYKQTWRDDFLKEICGFANAGKIIAENIVEKLSAMRERIVKILWQNPNATAQSISKEVGIAPRNVQEHLKYLQKAGILRRIGPDKGGHWEIAYRL